MKRRGTKQEGIAKGGGDRGRGNIEEEIMLYECHLHRLTDGKQIILNRHSRTDHNN